MQNIWVQVTNLNPPRNFKVATSPLVPILRGIGGGDTKFFFVSWCLRGKRVIEGLINTGKEVYPW